MPAKKSAVHKFAHEAMATVFEIFIAGREKDYAGQAARAAFDEIDRLERLFSRFDPSSETSRIGRLAPGGSLRVGLETAEVLGLSSFVQSETGGAFDIAYLGLEKAAGGRRRSRPRPLTSLLRIDTDGRGFEVTRVRPKGRASRRALDLDLGAVGKGYALDAALAVLRDWTVDNVLLHAGTSTALAVGPGPSGSGRGRGWPVGAGSTAEDHVGAGPGPPSRSRPERLGDRGQGRPYRRPPHGRTGRRARGGLGLASFGGGLGRPVDGLHGHGHKRCGRLLRPASGRLGPRENRPQNV